MDELRIRQMIKEEVFFALLDVYEALHQVVRDHKPYSTKVWVEELKKQMFEEGV